MPQGLYAPTSPVTIGDGVGFPARIDYADGSGIGGPALVIRHADGTNEVLRIDDARNFSAPQGLPFTSGWGVSAVVRGPSGYVAVGSTLFAVGRGNGDRTPQSLIWYSADGNTWTRVDPRAIVGDVPLDLQSVSATPDGFAAVGATADGYDLANKARTIVLTSPDGLAWTALPPVPATWSTDPRYVAVVGGHLTVGGVEYACFTDSGQFTTFSTGAQFRLWVLGDDGVTWSTISGPDTGVVVEPEHAPADASTCPVAGTFDFLNETTRRFSAKPAATAFTGGVVVVEEGGDRVAVSKDLTTWTIASLPDRLPSTDATHDSPEAPQHVVAYSTDGMLYVASIERPRGDDNIQLPGPAASQAIVWRSSDSGLTWERIPAGRPAFIVGSAAVAVGDSGVYLFDIDNGGGPELHVSTAGELVDYPTCEAAANAFCSFAESYPGLAPGADLTGIDLRGAKLGSDLDLSAVNLTTARLEGAVVLAPLTGANLTGVNARRASLFESDLTGSTVTSATFAGTDVNASILQAADLPHANLTGIRIRIRANENLDGADFSGLDLSNADFSSFQSVAASMKGASFRGATLVDVYFRRIDLTGADFSGVVFGNPNEGHAPGFFDVICPDGQPSDQTKTGASACRL